MVKDADRCVEVTVSLKG